MNKKLLRAVAAALAVSALLFVCSCGADKQDGTVIVGEGLDEGESRYTLCDTDSAKAADDVSCSALKSDGKITGYVLTFEWSADVDELMSSGENVYFALLGSDKNKQTVPMEYVKVIKDSEKKSFSVTVSLPDETSAPDSGEVQFCVAALDGAVATVLFTASAVCK